MDCGVSTPVMSSFLPSSSIGSPFMAAFSTSSSGAPDAAHSPRTALVLPQRVPILRAPHLAASCRALRRGGRTAPYAQTLQAPPCDDRCRDPRARDRTPGAGPPGVHGSRAGVLPAGSAAAVPRHRPGLDGVVAPDV